MMPLLCVGVGVGVGVGDAVGSAEAGGAMTAWASFRPASLWLPGDEAVAAVTATDPMGVITAVASVAMATM